MWDWDPEQKQPMNDKSIHGCCGWRAVNTQALKQGPKTRLTQDARCEATMRPRRPYVKEILRNKIALFGRRFLTMAS